MGGMIAQEIAISFPQRVRSLTSIMSTTGNPKIPGPTREAMAVLMAPPPKSQEEFLERYGKTWKVLRAGSFPEDEALDRGARRAHLRPRPQSSRRRPSAPRHPRFRQPQGAASHVKTPTLVIHGTVDPLVHPAGGKDTAASIPGASSS